MAESCILAKIKRQPMPFLGFKATPSMAVSAHQIGSWELRGNPGSNPFPRSAAVAGSQGQPIRQPKTMLYIFASAATDDAQPNGSGHFLSFPAGEILQIRQRSTSGSISAALSSDRLLRALAVLTAPHLWSLQPARPVPPVLGVQVKDAGYLTLLIFPFFLLALLRCDIIWFISS